MPIYEYQCLRCGKRTEILQRLDEAPLAACPECGGEVKKLISSPAFQFKGSGWYATDYAGKKGSESKSESKAEGKADEGGKAEKLEKPKEAAAGATSSGSSGSE
ncbi:MAG TPA: FmdB family zinc ribbon protein [Thermoanaerobaculia bacterium]|jgi:putative FmdB family regulatory protein|nr:FmdB family zinc ribbon protein [Thermoanaerobaculia bacterium]